MEPGTERSLVEAIKHARGRFGGFSFGGNVPDGVTVKDPLPKGVTFPNGAKTAVALTFDVEGNYGNGTGEQKKEIANYKRICAGLKKNGIKGTFYVVGKYVEDEGPEFVQWILDSGNEVGSHGYVHDLNEMYGGEYVYAGHYGKEENLKQVKDGILAVNKVRPSTVKGFRFPYGHFNEFSYEAVAECGIKYTSNVGKDDFNFPDQGFGSQPFTMQLGDVVYPLVEIPLDSQTFDWAMWVADENANKPFVDAVRLYCKSRDINFQRTPKFAVEIWRQRLEDAVKESAVCSFLAHPINFAVKNETSGDVIDEFILPVFDMIGEMAIEKNIWVCTNAELADYYLDYQRETV